MGWVTEDGTHEGWAAPVLPDGRVSSASGGGGMHVRPVGADGRVIYAGNAEIVDGRQAIGWRGMCECGWAGPLWRRVESAGEHSLTDRLVFQPPTYYDTKDHGRIDARIWGDAPAEVEAAIQAEWKAHLEPETVAAVRQAATEARAAQAALDQAVTQARAAGASWTDIGAAAGISRQSAHERWAAKTTTTTTTTKESA